ncbi:MAG: hypothetical protein WC156_13005 [Pedobacter sp.]
MEIDKRMWDDICMARDGIYGALGTIVFGSMTANVVLGDIPFKAWIPSDYEPTVAWHIVGGMAVVMLFLYSFAKLYAHRQVFQNIRGLRQQKCTRGYRGLILMPSASNHKTFCMPDNKDCFMELNGICLEGKSLQEDIDKLNGEKLNWQQLLRCLLPHTHSLDALFVIGSKDAEEFDTKTNKKTTRYGSFVAIDSVQRIVNQYCTRNPKLLRFDTPVDFEDFTNLQAAIIEGLNLMRRDYGIEEEDIIIDVTGGQKTTSIAGAAVTLNRRVAFQYVQTNPPFEVWEYDLAMRSPAST